MATEKIKIENGAFITEDGPSKHVETSNGWKGDIGPDGSILFVCRKEYAYGKASMRYQVKKNGYATLTLHETDSKPVVRRRGFVVEKGAPLDGTIGLSGGRIQERYAYFRMKEFQDFLDAHKILHVVKQDPNGEFGEPDRGSEIITDGIPVPEDFRTKWFSECSSFQMHTLTSGASYLRMVNRETTESVLYTLRNPMKIDLTDIPVTSGEIREYYEEREGYVIMHAAVARAFAEKNGLEYGYIFRPKKKTAEITRAYNLYDLSYGDPAGFKRSEMEEKGLLQALLDYREEKKLDYRASWEWHN